MADSAALRKTVYALLITLAVGAAAGRILAASLVFHPVSFRDETNANDPRKPWPKSRPRPTAMCSSNDRSRWATVRSLVDEGTYAVGKRDKDEPGGTNEYGDRGIIFEDGWTSVDKVLNPTTHEFLSSKPPLLATLVAGEYWLLRHLLGWSFVETPDRIVRFILITINVVPFAIYLWLLSRLVERFGQTDWGRLYVMAAACLGTIVLPFMGTFNNHTPATCAALAALYIVIEIWSRPEEARLSWYALAGLLAGFTMTLELPAAALLAAFAILLFLRSPRRTLTGFAPGALVPVIALFITNYAATGQLALVYSKLNTPWYQYDGSHWKPSDPPPRGIDYLNEPKFVYAFHLLVGHHGLFSLTPIFFLSLAGLVLGLPRKAPPANDDVAEARPAMPWFLIPLTAFLTLLLLVFYIFFAPGNYGGGTCGPRWLMWLTPFLLLTILPAADRLAEHRWGRWLAYALLVVSIVSAVYPMQNPWRHPWISDWMGAQGWLPY